MTKINRKKYDINFKKEAIALVEKEGYSLGEAAIRFGKRPRPEHLQRNG